MKARNKKWYLMLIICFLAVLVLLNGFSRGKPATDVRADEIYMVNLINRERVKRNLPSLTIDPTLARIARDRAFEMLELNYFDHESPISGSLNDRLSINKLTGWLSAGENLAQASDIESAFKALMKSKLHRINILNPDFTHIGIGIVDGGVYGEIITQNFIQYGKDKEK